MAYTHVQFIAYEVPTGVALPAGSCGPGDLEICKEVETDSAYQQAVAALSLDAKVRITRLLAVIDLARSSKARTDEDTLKIFMAPEFYLRPEQGGASRSYAATDMVAAQQLFRMVFSQAKLSGWVCVLGTMVWSMKGAVTASSAETSQSKAVEKYLERLKALKDNDLVYNSAMVGVGGQGIWVYDKVNYAEQADEIAKANWPLKDYCLHGPLQTIVEAGNVHCGIEICRDHQNRLLNKGMAELTKSFGNQQYARPKLDVQLLTACGMPIQKNSVIVGQYHPVFRVDGAVEESDELFGEFTHSEVQSVLEADDRSATKMVTPGTDRELWDELNKADRTELSGDLKLDVSGKMGRVQKNNKSVPLDACFPQRLVVYPYLSLTH